MNFSESIPYSHIQFSPSGKFLAVAKGPDLFIFDSKTLSHHSKYQFPDGIISISWSPDEAFIYAILLKHQQLHLRCLEPSVVEFQNDGWTGHIKDTAAGILAAVWAPDSRQIITFSDFQLRATIWNLTEKEAKAYIRNPKLLPPKGISFTQNKKFACLSERRDLKDWVSIYYAGQDWKMVNTFETETFDLADIKWIKEDTAICVIDSPVENRVLIYSAMTGEPLAKHLGGQSFMMGVKNLNVSPNGLFMVIGYFESKAKVINAYSQKEITVIEH